MDGFAAMWALRWRRLGERFRLSLDARLFSGVPVTDPLLVLRDDGFLQIKLQYYF